MRVLPAIESIPETRNLPRIQMDVEQPEDKGLDPNTKVGDITVGQLFNLLSALVNKSFEASYNGTIAAHEKERNRSKVITPKFTA